MLPTFPTMPNQSELGHLIYDRIPNVFDTAGFYWQTLRNPAIQLENYPISKERIDNAKILVDEVEKEFRWAKKLRKIVLENDFLDDELSSILDASSLMEEDEILQIKTSRTTHNNVWSIENGLSLNLSGNKRKRV